MLKLENVYKTFNPGTLNEVKALRGVDLTIEEGLWVVVIGTNGSGKSTLLNAVAGNVMIDSGSIELSEEDITYWPEHKRASIIGRVFQNPFSGTAPNMTIAENLALASKRGFSRGIDMALKREVFESFR
ncbi:MAG: ATP-binding cassette domain-containing protein, partial [Candidatus Dadabacteria bacterium]|nr:ATP-binding cassette domain-containing protein [Candidatus Dadabacteria bacterium]